MTVFIRMTIVNSAITAIEAARVNIAWDIVSSYFAVIQRDANQTGGVTIAKSMRALSSIIEKSDKIIFFSQAQHDTFVKAAKPYTDFRLVRHSYIIPPHSPFNIKDTLSTIIDTFRRSGVPVSSIHTKKENNE